MFDMEAFFLLQTIVIEATTMFSSVITTLKVRYVSIL
jgi:hypothetical protein